MAGAEIRRESETGRGWRYEVALRGGERVVEVTLDWSDHDHWSAGAAPPSRVVGALIEVLEDARVRIPDRFDASTARRLVGDLDDRMMRRLGG